MNLDHVISEIYPVTTSSSEWERALDVIVSHAGAEAGLFFRFSTDAAEHVIPYMSSFYNTYSADDMAYVNEVTEKYDREAWDTISKSRKQTLVADTDVWNINDLDVRRDVVLVREKYGLRRRLGTKLSDCPGWFESLALQYSERHRHIPSESRTALKQVLPHLAKAAEINRRLGVLEQQYHAVLMALDNIHIGVCVLNASGQVEVSNTEAKRIFERKTALWIGTRGELKGHDRSVRPQLLNAVQCIHATACGHGKQTAIEVAVERKGAGMPVIVEFVPVSDSLSEIASGWRGVIAYIIDPAYSLPVDVGRLAQLCGLTSAEKSVCKRIAEGLSNKDIADERDVSLETVKTQCSHVFRKTNTKSRSDLIRLAFNISPPIFSSRRGR